MFDCDRLLSFFVKKLSFAFVLMFDCVRLLSFLKISGGEFGDSSGGVSEGASPHTLILPFL